MKKLVLLFLSFVISLSFLGCNGENNVGGNTSENVLTVALGQSTAYFTEDDVALYPILGDTPYEGEYVEKRIKIVFSNAEKIALAFRSENEIPAGLKFTVNNGEVKDFSSGEFYVADVEKADTELTVKIKMWLSKDASDQIADTQFGFSIEAMGE